MTSRKDPVLVESLQQLRTNVEFAIHESPDGLVVAITSTREGEGKSTIAANLAWMLASVGHDVLLIDADLRRPALHRILDLPQGPGLAMAPADDIGNLLESTRLPTLHFLPSGIPDRHPAEVVSAGLPKVIGACRAPNRVIVIDTPPLGSAAETPLIASIAGTVVLVIDGRRQNPDDLEDAVAEIHERGAHLLGVVMNRMRARHMTSRPNTGYLVDTQFSTMSNGASNGSNGHGAAESHPVNAPE